MRTNVTHQSCVLVTGNARRVEGVSVILVMLDIDANIAVTQQVTVTETGDVA